MAYIRTKHIGNNDYLYEQESYRDSKGEVHTKHVRYVGKAGMVSSGNLGTTKIKKVESKKDVNHIDRDEFHSVHESHNPFSKKYRDGELNRHMIVTIPSTQGQKHVSQKTIDSRAREVATYMTDKFHGSTRIKGEGTYFNKKYNKVDSENITKVEVFMNKDDWKKDRKDVQSYLIKKQKDWRQEDLAVEYDTSSAMYFIREPEKKK